MPDQLVQLNDKIMGIINDYLQIDASFSENEHSKYSAIEGCVYHQRLEYFGDIDGLRFYNLIHDIRI